MADQNLLAKLGLRLGVLGSAAALAISAPLAAANYDPSCSTAASRIGVYFDRTGGAEKMGLVVMGTETVSLSLAASTFNNTVVTPAATTAAAGLRLPHGAAPTTGLTDGDVWTTTSGVYARISGATVGPFGAGTISGTIANTQIAFGNTTANSIQGAATLKYLPASSGVTIGTLTGSGALGGIYVSGVNSGDSYARGILISNITAGYYSTAYGIAISGVYSSGPGSASYGIYVNNVTGGVANNYGIYITNVDAAGGYGVYQDTAGILNFFASSTGIGLTATTTTFLGLGASTTAKSSLRLPHGTAPSNPVNGDIWTTSTGLYVRINGTTIGPLT